MENVEAEFKVGNELHGSNESKMQMGSGCAWKRIGGGGGGSVANGCEGLVTMINIQQSTSHHAQGTCKANDEWRNDDGGWVHMR